MLIVTGTIAYDYIMEFPGEFGEHILPHQTHNINLSFIVDKFARMRGGTGGNVSYSLGLLGIPHTIFAYAGHDSMEYIKEFEAIGINTKHVFIDKTSYTATGFAMTDKANNQIWGYFYGAAEKSKELQLAAVAQKGDLVYIGPQGTEGSMSLVNQCIMLNIPYLFDPGFILTQVSTPQLKRGIECALYVTCNEYELELIKSRIPSWKKLFHGKTIITTLGEKGARIDTDKKTYFIEPVHIKHIVSTSGAGDAWRAGFLAGLHKNFDIQTCGEMGSVTSAFAVNHYGTQQHIFTKKQFVDAYKKTFRKSLAL